MAASSKLIYQGRVISLLKRKTRLPNGRSVDLELIKHPGAVLIIPFLDSRRIVFIRQFRPAVRATLYELPAGTLGRKEAPLACARREIAEETGYAARKIVRLGSVFPVPGYSTEKIVIYKAGGLYKKFLPGDDDEVIEPCILERAAVRRLLRTGRLQDAKTIAALVLCGWL